MNGGLLLGSREGINIEIAEDIGENNLFLFSKRPDEANLIRNQTIKSDVDEQLRCVIEHLLSEKLGKIDYISQYFKSLISGNDYFLVLSDFQEYSKIQKSVDKSYKDKELWNTMVFNSICKMGRFSMDRALYHFNNKYWGLRNDPIPNPAYSINERIEIKY